MIQLFKNVNIDWLGKRRFFISISIVLLLVGMGSALYRQAFHPNGTEAFNLGVDFKGGTVVTVKFNQPPSVEAIRSAIDQAGIKDATIQPVLDKPGMFLIRLPKQEEAAPATTPPVQANASQAQVNAPQAQQAGVDPARAKVGQALSTFGQGNADIQGTDAVGEIAGKQLRNQAVAVTLAALVGMLLFIAFRFEWTYGAAAVIAVFHTVLVTLGLFAGIVFGTYDAIAVASPIMVWWQRRLEPTRMQPATTRSPGAGARTGAAQKGTAETKAQAAARGSQGAARS